MAKTILQINNVYGYNSVGRITVGIHNTLMSQDYQSMVAYGRDAINPDENTVRIGNNFDLNFHAALARVTDKQGLYSKTATRSFLVELDKLKPDIIHLQVIHGYYLNYELLFSYIKEKNIPTVWTFHDCWAFTGHCAFFDMAGCEKWRIGCFSCPEKSTYPKSIFMDYSKKAYLRKQKAFTNVDKMVIVTPSEWLANLVGQSFLKDYPRKVIYNGIDLDLFKTVDSNETRRKIGLREDDFVMLGIASNFKEKRKGAHYFIDIAGNLADGEKIVLVGVDEKTRRQMPSNIICLPRTSNINELASLYSMADVLVNPSMEDNFPSVTIEALACGTPIVAFRTGGIPEQVPNGCGFIAERGNLESLVQCIREVKLKGKDYFKQNCINHSKLFEQKKKYMEYVRLYEDLLRSI